MNKIKINLSKKSILSIINEMKDTEIEINEIGVNAESEVIKTDDNKCDTSAIVEKLEELIIKLKALYDYSDVGSIEACREVLLNHIEKAESIVYKIQSDSESIMQSLATMFKLIYSNYHKKEYNKCIDLIIEMISIIKYMPQCKDKPILNEEGNEAYVNVAYISKLEDSIKILCELEESPSKSLTIATVEKQILALVQHLKISSMKLRNIALLKFACSCYVNYNNENYIQCTRDLNDMISIIGCDKNEVM